MQIQYSLFRAIAAGMKPTIAVILASVLVLFLQGLHVHTYGLPQEDSKHFGKLAFLALSCLLGAIVYLVWQLKRVREIGFERFELEQVRASTWLSYDEIVEKERAIQDRRSRRAHDRAVAALAAGARVRTGEVDYSDPLASGLQPAKVLIALTDFAGRFPRYDELTAENYLARTGGSPSPDERALLERQRTGIEAERAASPNYKLAVRRLAQAGIHARIGGQGDYCGDFVVERVSGYVDHLQKFEALAAEDVGITSRKDRAEAAERFTIFMLRNYSQDFEKHRATLPDVGGSPYHPEGTWHST